MNIRVEYEPTPIRHIAVECPKCKKWFRGNDISDIHISNDGDLYFAHFTCPVCHSGFDKRSSVLNNITEIDYPKVYEGCLEKEEVWK